jgi:hypothetical protein
VAAGGPPLGRHAAARRGALCNAGVSDLQCRAGWARPHPGEAGAREAGPISGPKQTGREGIANHMTNDHDHDTVVVEDRGSGIGTILGVIVILALLVGIWYFAFGPGQGTFTGSDTGTDINVDVNVPSLEAPAQEDAS